MAQFQAMARMARVVIPNIPHHVTQRGVRRMDTFFDDEDYEMYLSLMRDWCLSSGVEIWAYCLMPNHVHLIAMPDSKDGLAHGIGEAHRRYTRYITTRKAGRVIYGKVALLHFRWMRNTFWRRFDMLNSIR